MKGRVSLFRRRLFSATGGPALPPIRHTENAQQQGGGALRWGYPFPGKIAMQSLRQARVLLFSCSYGTRVAV